jgi:hypothetical protein
MPCTVDNPCGGVLREDETITRDLASDGVLGRRIFSCINAHHFVVDVFVRSRKRRQAKEKRGHEPREDDSLD